MTLDWGDVPTWIAALAATGAFIIYYRLLRSDLQTQQEAREQDRLEVPRRVNAWIEGEELYVSNTGSEPVYDVVVYVGPAGTNFDSPEYLGRFLELVWGTAAPDTVRNEKVGRQYVATATLAPFPSFPEVAIEFTDSSGTYWRRGPRGPVREIAHRRPYD